MYRFFCLLLCCLIAHADEIYRWRDAQGHLHYGELIPDNIPYEQLDEAKLPPLHTVPAVVPDKPIKSRAPQSKNRSHHIAKPDPAIKQCRRYREQLETIQSRLRAGYREPAGNRLRARRRQIEQRLREEC